VWTGKNRSATNVLKDQKKNIKKNYINLNLLNNFTKKFLNEIKAEKLNIKKMGTIVSKTWDLKKNLSKLVTSNSINRIYNEIVNKISYGGKLLGAGNGGFILIMFDLKKRKKIMKSLKKYQYLNVKLEKNGTVTL
jgi:D-glycero-alpha-D-manno-heptose-7-phosphate kinase